MSGKSPRNRGKSWLLGPGKGRVAHDRVFGLGTNAKKIASGGNRVHIVSGPGSIMDIPDDSLCDRNGTDLYLEVRGTQDNGESVSLMPKEVEHARNHANSALLIVHAVNVD